jgi:capsular exopolysaccharide synthesis family protein
VLLALIVAVLLGFGAVVVAEQSDRRLRHPDELGSSTGGLPLLSAIPISAFQGPSPHAEEAFSTLRASLTYFNIDRDLTSVLITSPGKEDGKTTVAVRLSQALARDGKDVILLDADMRRPATAGLLGLPPSEGLGAVLVGQLPLDHALIDVTSDNGRGGRLRVLPAGSPPPNPSELIGSNRMGQLLAELQERSEILIIDSTPILTVSDSIPILRDISGVVLVARVNRTSREAIKRLREVVDSAGGNALGVVATHAPSGGLYVARGYGYEAAYAQISSREEAHARWLDKVVRKNGDDAERATASKSD